ncbi:STM4015 family protein [Nocardiopsis lambiniae]|uniref:STM4015 family protein n=1 Tax=Nocardiopsis lambiniae TaxID=3075539 RepID=A0ABU2M9S1_9ACTN|nr:STM4015 family protein [Nocardiopsis sp. DSM 44743]MDT0329006.1 STM4015 family protein [Nocardiopsis sp. DSM 44743]
MINAHLSEFAGLPVFEYTSTKEMSSKEPRYGSVDPLAQLAALRAPDAYAWRLGVDSYEPEEEFAEYFGDFVKAADTTAVRAMVIGPAGSSESEEPGTPARDALLEHAAAFPALRALFIGDIVVEESEISWIHQPDLSPLFAAFPNLAEFTVRGTGDPYMHETSQLGLDIGRHDALRSLTVQSGGLPAPVARGIDSAEAPGLERLELWLGVEDYRGDTTPEDLARTLSGEAFPNLNHLGLRNAEESDVWVRALADAPVVGRLRSLDLSMGTLTDEGARVLLDAPVFRELGRLDLEHHYMSEEMEGRVRNAFTEAGVDVRVGDRQVPNGDRLYPSVTE